MSDLSIAPWPHVEPIAHGIVMGVPWAVMPGPPWRKYTTANGYALLPEGHPWNDLDLTWDDSEQVEVHGGITYQGPPDPHGRWIGFDTTHAWDYWPGSDDDYMLGDPTVIHWTVEMVIEEAKKLARQVAAVSAAGNYQI